MRDLCIPLYVIPAILLVLATPACKQQTASTVEPSRTADLSWRPEIANPAYEPGMGPTVIVDEVHNNFHTSVTTYLPFAELLRQDGYIVLRGTEEITQEVPQKCCIHVIVDAQPPPRSGDPPTFNSKEVEILKNWIRSGGAHLPGPQENSGEFSVFSASNLDILIQAPRSDFRLIQRTCWVP